MSDTGDYELTPNLGLYKPVVDADLDMWGDHLNLNADILDGIVPAIQDALANYLPLAGGTMSGGISFGSRYSFSRDDMSGHLMLYGTGAGIVPTNGILNYNVPITWVHNFRVGGTDVFFITSNFAQLNTGLGLRLGRDATAPLEAVTLQQLTASEANYLPLDGSQPMTGPLRLPNGTLAAPSLQFGTNDGTGISRSGAALLLGVTGNPSLGVFPSGGQFYGPLSMLNNKITQVGDATAAGDALNLRTGDARYMQGGGRAVPQLSLSNDVAVIENTNGSVFPSRGPTLTGYATPFDGDSAYFQIQPRRLATPDANGLQTSGPAVSLYDFEQPLTGGRVSIWAGPDDPGLKPWDFRADHLLSMPGGIKFTDALAPGDNPADMTNHIDLYGGIIGINVTSNTMNLRVPPGSEIALYAGTTLATISETGIWTNGGLSAATANIGQNSGNAQPLRIQSNGTYARISYYNTNIREWTAGVGPDGSWGCYDESAGARRMHIDTGGNMMLDSGGYYANYVRSYGTFMCDSGIFYVANNTNYYLGRSGADGYWRFVENGTENFNVQPNGNTVTRGNAFVNGNVLYFGGGGAYVTWNGVAVQTNGGSYFDILQPNTHCYGGLIVDGAANIAGPVDVGDLRTHSANGILYSAYGHWAAIWADFNTGNVWIRIDGGIDCLAGNWSDERLKDDIAPSTFDCLAAVLATSLYEFRFKGGDALIPVGFVAQRQEEAFPESVADGATKGINTNVMLAALCGAVQQLAAEITELKQRTIH